MLELTDETFEQEVLQSSTPAVVDFWAPWCGPCRSMAPHYAQATPRLAPAFRVCKLNTEEAQEQPARYAIRSIPTLALFQQGREVARQPGAMDASNIVAWANQHRR